MHKLIATSLGLILILLGFLYLQPELRNNLEISPPVGESPEVKGDSATQEFPINEEGLVAQVTKVIDGDTIEISGGKRLRYIGIDTPETDQCFGKQATDFNKSLVLGKSVKIIEDVQKLDKYGRILAYVYTEQGFINMALVEEGYAKAATFPPNVRYQELFKKAETAARLKKAGLWQDNSCSISTTSDENKESEESVNLNSSPSGCSIKGNINSDGDKIYHTPGQQYYSRTQVDDDKGERWFCSENEAVNAGWRKSKV